MRKTALTILRVLGMCLVLLSSAIAESAVLQWNEAALLALKQDASAPLLVARTMAILHLAIRDAEEGASSSGGEGAVVGAGYEVARTLLPARVASFEKLRDQQISALGGRDRLKEGLALGEAAARKVIESRADDGSSMHISYVPDTAPGAWRRTPPFFRPPELPQWASRVKPFVLQRPDQFRPPGPPALASQAWAKAMNELKELGGNGSVVRTPEQTEIAKFWSDFSYTETPPGHWNSIARSICREHSMSERECARLFATLNVALHDAGIACWDAKYHFNFWRPVTAIGRAGEDGNDATTAAPDWTPFLKTPAHPEYPSGHSSFSGAAVVVLAQALGGDKINFSVSSDGLAGVVRKFHSLRTCAEECGVSRIYGGIHYRFSCEDGLRLGEKVGQWVIKAAR